jgi:hypothetical protein
MLFIAEIVAPSGICTMDVFEDDRVLGYFVFFGGFDI